MPERHARKTQHLLPVYVGADRPLDGLRWLAYPRRYRACVSVFEAQRQAVYTLSVPNFVLRPIDIDALERQCLAIYRAASSHGEVVALVGPELEIIEAQSVTEAIAAACDPASLASWIIAPRQYLLPGSDLWPFEVSHVDADVVLLRHRDAAERVT